MSLEPLREPGTEAPEPQLTTGLCARPWCEDAALPNDEFCAECLADVLAMEAELLGDEAA